MDCKGPVKIERILFVHCIACEISGVFSPRASMTLSYRWELNCSKHRSIAISTVTAASMVLVAMLVLLAAMMLLSMVMSSVTAATTIRLLYMVEVVAHVLCVLLLLRILTSGPSLGLMSVARPQIDLTAILLPITMQIENEARIGSMPDPATYHHLARVASARKLMKRTYLDQSTGAEMWKSNFWVQNPFRSK